MKNIFSILAFVLLLVSSSDAYYKKANFAFGTTSSVIANADTTGATFTVAPSSKSEAFPASNFIVVIYSASCNIPSTCSNREIMLISSRSGNTLTIGARDQEGTTHTGNWAIGSKIHVNITKGAFEEIESEIATHSHPWASGGSGWDTLATQNVVNGMGFVQGTPWRTSTTGMWWGSINIQSWISSRGYASQLALDGKMNKWGSTPTSGNLVCWDGTTGDAVKDCTMSPEYFAASIHTHSYSSLSGLPTLWDTVTIRNYGNTLWSTRGSWGTQDTINVGIGQGWGSGGGGGGWDTASAKLWMTTNFINKVYTGTGFAGWNSNTFGVFNSWNQDFEFNKLKITRGSNSWTTCDVGEIRAWNSIVQYCVATNTPMNIGTGVGGSWGTTDTQNVVNGMGFIIGAPWTTSITGMWWNTIDIQTWTSQVYPQKAHTHPWGSITNPPTTDGISEGSTNLYWTSLRTINIGDSRYSTIHTHPYVNAWSSTPVSGNLVCWDGTTGSSVKDCTMSPEYFAASIHQHQWSSLAGLPGWMSFDGNSNHALFRDGTWKTPTGGGGGWGTTDADGWATGKGYITGTPWHTSTTGMWWGSTANQAWGSTNFINKTYSGTGLAGWNSNVFGVYSAFNQDFETNNLSITRGDSAWTTCVKGQIRAWGSGSLGSKVYYCEDTNTPRPIGSGWSSQGYVTGTPWYTSTTGMWWGSTAIQSWSSLQGYVTGTPWHTSTTGMWWGSTANQAWTSNKVASILIWTTPASASSTGATTSRFAAGETVTALSAIIMASSGKWMMTDANSSALYDGLVALSLEAKNDTEAMNVAIGEGIVRWSSWSWTTLGARLYLWDTVGVISQSRPTTGSAAVRVIGHVVSPTEIYFRPSQNFITIWTTGG